MKLYSNKTVFNKLFRDLIDMLQLNHQDRVYLIKNHISHNHLSI